MSWKPNEIDIVDYLYGELAPDKQIAFEKYLEQNPDFSLEVQELKLTQSILPQIPDEEVIPPLPVTASHMTNSVMNTSRKWLYPISIAASMAAILLVGYLTKFSMSIRDGGFNLGFNNNLPSVVEPLTKSEIDDLIESKVKLASEQWGNKISELQYSFTSQLEQNKRLTEAEIKRVANNKPQTEIEEEQILAFVAQLQNENKKNMQSFYQVSATEQKQYMRNILLDFQEYLDVQRQKDLQLIQTNMLVLKNDSDLKLEETDKILANIITQVNGQNSLGQ